MVVEDILREVRCPLLSVRSFVGDRTGGAIGQEDVDNPPFIVDGEDVLEPARGQARP
jgi:hypothetical protein